MGAWEGQVQDLPLHRLVFDPPELTPRSGSVKYLLHTRRSVVQCLLGRLLAVERSIDFRLKCRACQFLVSNTLEVENAIFCCCFTKENVGWIVRRIEGFLGG